MKAITIHQPWAQAIAEGAKTTENRSWKTAYRGPLAIHAGRTTKLFELKADGLLRPLESLCLPDEFNRPVNAFLFSSIIAVTELVDCVHISDINEFERDTFCTGPWCWKLRNTVALKNPIPSTGQQMLWAILKDMEKKIKLQIPLHGTASIWRDFCAKP